MANRTYLENNDQRLEQVVEHLCYELPHSTKPACVLRSGTCPHEKSLTAGETVSTVVSRRDVEGHERFASVRAAPLRDESGKVCGVVEAIRDITQRMEIERELLQRDAQLSETRRRLDEILTNSRDIIFLADIAGQVLAFNQGAVLSLGYATGELKGQSVSTLAVDPGVLEGLLEQTRREGHATGYELELRNKTGEIVVCNLSLTAYGDTGADDSEIIGIGRDITTRMRLKEEIFHKEQLAATGKMAAGVAHEINNPLAVIDTIAGLVEDTIAEARRDPGSLEFEELDTAMKRLRHQVKRATSITHSLLGFVRKSVGDVQVVDLARLLEESLNLLAPRIKQGAVDVRRSFAADLPHPVTDPMLLQQIMVNLLDNAIDAMEERGGHERLLEIGTARCGEDRVAVYVQDNGVGIPQEAQAEIFELFHTSKPVGRGTGIGLAIVLDIVKRLGADISVESEPGQGSRFTVTLPLEQA
jgi:PAS domain S-box-containing protein